MTTNPTPEEESIESATIGWVAWCERRGMSGLSAHLIRMRAALAHPTPAVAVAQPSAGWKQVPETPTEAMLNAADRTVSGYDDQEGDFTRRMWRNMLAAAPKAYPAKPPAAPPTGAGEPTTAWLIELADHTSARIGGGAASRPTRTIPASPHGRLMQTRRFASHASKMPSLR